MFTYPLQGPARPVPVAIRFLNGVRGNAFKAQFSQDAAKFAAQACSSNTNARPGSISKAEPFAKAECHHASPARGCSHAKKQYVDARAILISNAHGLDLPESKGYLGESDPHPQKEAARSLINRIDRKIRPRPQNQS